jgi:NAD(P)-dependent dehydrogenase (short-subunit alcohol dehydrogenase family)
VDQTLPKTLSPYKFRADASYVLSGGLGGIGRSVACWMVSRGAKHLIFLSRSGASSEVASAIVGELRDKSCNVAVGVCDVSDERQLMKTIEGYTSSMPPIRGCIQCSMELKGGS